MHTPMRQSRLRAVVSLIEDGWPRRLLGPYYDGAALAVYEEAGLG